MNRNFLLCILATIFFSCASHKAVETSRKDSIRTEVRYEKTFLCDTVFLTIPLQTSERTTCDSVSHFENDFAVSDARINPDGTLFHVLKTKPQDKPVPVDKEIIRKDSIVYVDRETKVPTPIIKKQTWWERAKIRYGGYAIGVLTFGVIIVIWIVKNRK